jgi:hypothetical protein
MQVKLYADKIITIIIAIKIMQWELNYLLE